MENIASENKSSLLYLSRNKDFSLLNKEEEIALAKKIQAGDIKARDKLILHNQGLVVMVAHRFLKPGLELEDLVMHGNIGLIQAAEKYLPDTYNTRFSTYAVWWIRQAIDRGSNYESNNIRLPTHIFKLVKKYQSIVISITQATGIAPTDKQILDRFNNEIDHFTLERIKTYSDNQSTISFDVLSSRAEEEGFSILDTLSGADHKEVLDLELEKEDIKDLLKKVLGNLSLSERTVLSMRYGLLDSKNYTLDDIAKMMNLTRERIRQIQGAAIRKLRRHLVWSGNYSKDVLM